jgi:co-chaperonin GroES (HSP10)
MYSMSNITRLKIKEFHPCKDKVFVTDLETGETITKAGLIITDDNMTNRGIRPRWGKVWAIGDEVKDIEVGQWILIEHGRWTQKITFEIDDDTVNVWSVEYPKSVLVVSDDDPRGTAFAPHKPGYEFATRKLGW